MQWDFSIQAIGVSSCFSYSNFSSKFRTPLDHIPVENLTHVLCIVNLSQKDTMPVDHLVSHM